MGTRNIENQDFDFGEQGNGAIYFSGTREQVPTPWEGLSGFNFTWCHISLMALSKFCSFQEEGRTEDASALRMHQKLCVDGGTSANVSNMKQEPEDKEYDQ